MIKSIFTLLLGTIQRFNKHHGAFLASGLAFDIFICILPFLVIIISLLGYFLESSQHAQQEILRLFETVLPEALYDIDQNLKDFLQKRHFLGVVGLSTLLLAASRVFSGIRIVLNIIYNKGRKFNFILGKLFDIGMVVLVGLFFLLSVGASSVLALWKTWSDEKLAMAGFNSDQLYQIIGPAVAYFFTSLMFYLMYRLPLMRIVRRKIVLIQAIVVATLWEIAKWLFGFYIINIGKFDVLYGSFGVLIVLVLWIYYSAAIFVVGAELGSTLHSLRK